MKKLKTFLIVAIIASLFACTPSSPKKTQKTENLGFLKIDISQAELNNPEAYKRYSYTCKNFETNERTHLTTYFPLSRESRKQENFGIYFQLNGGKAYPFDHIENINLNRRGTKFEVHYRSYQPIDGSYVDLRAREHSSIYYKNYQPWLECRER